MTLFAQVVVQQPTFWQNVASAVAAFVVPVLGSAMIGLIGMAVAYLHSAWKGSRFERAISVIEEAAAGIATKIKTDLLPAVVRATAADSPGGVAITAEERAQLMAQAVSMLKTEVAPWALKVIGAAVGGTIDSWLASKVETAVSIAATQPAATVVVPVNPPPA